MKKLKLRNNILEAIIVFVMINVITMLVWICLRLVPVLNVVDEIKEKVNSNAINEIYENEKDLLKELEFYEKDNDLEFSVIHKGIEINKYQSNEKEFLVLSQMIEINDEYYFISGYYQKIRGALSLFFELLGLELAIILIYIMIIYMLAKTKIIEPIEHIITDVKNYKLGLKPKKKKSLDNEFGLLQNDFFELMDSLEYEKNEQRRIIASISHDIKTPLTSIIGYSSLINDSDLTKEEVLEYNNKIHEKSLHIKNILNTFDEYLVNQNNQIIKKSDILISDLIEYLKNEYELELKNINISFNVKSDVSDEMIKVDILKIKRIFANVISNSVRYLDKSGSIDVFITKKKKEYIFTIKDNGPGTKEEILDKIFEPLFTTDNSRKISGLGLSIVKEFVEMHEGKVKAYNENGFVIEFTIPITKKAKKDFFVLWK